MHITCIVWTICESDALHDIMIQRSEGGPSLALSKLPSFKSTLIRSMSLPKFMVIIFWEAPKTVIFNALNLALVCRDNMLNDELLYVCVCVWVCVCEGPPGPPGPRGPPRKKRRRSQRGGSRVISLSVSNTVSRLHLISV